MYVKDIAELIEDFAPTDYYEGEDNSGIQIDTGEDVSRILVCLELNDDVLAEAINKDADMIITHHPLLFYPVSRIDVADPVGRYISTAIANGVSIYSSHLAFDNARRGNNMHLAELLRLEGVVYPENWEVEDDEDEIGGPNAWMEANGIVLEPDNGEEDEFVYDEDNPGSMGYLPKIMTLDEVCLYVERCLDLPQNYIRVVDGGCDEIEKVAFCTGAGGDFAKTAIENDCQLLITGDLKFHEAQYAKAMGLSVIDAGHYGTEKIFTKNFAEILREALEEADEDDIEVLEATSNTNPYTL